MPLSLFFNSLANFSVEIASNFQKIKSFREGISFQDNKSDPKSLLLRGTNSTLRFLKGNYWKSCISQKASGMSLDTDLDGPVWREDKQNSCISLSDELIQRSQGEAEKIEAMAAQKELGKHSKYQILLTVCELMQLEAGNFL